MKKVAFISPTHGVYGGGQVYLEGIINDGEVNRFFEPVLITSDGVIYSKKTIKVPKIDGWGKLLINTPRLISIIRKESFDVVVLNDIRLGIVSPLIRPFVCSKVVTLVHMELSNVRRFSPPLSVVLPELKSLLIRCGSHKILNVAKTNERLIRKSVFVGNYLPSFMRDSSSKHSIRRDIDLLYVGRISEEKNLSYLISIIKEIVSIDAGITCKIIGGGESEDDIKRLSKEAGVSQNIDFLGFVDRGELYEYYRRSKSIILTSHTEGFPTTILEACSNGCSFVSTNVGSVEYINETYRVGCIIDKHDSAVSARKINQHLLKCNDEDFSSLLDDYSQEKFMMNFISQVNDV